MALNMIPAVSLADGASRRDRSELAGTRKSTKFRFIDLFAGIGGLRRGFDAIGGECVLTCEWNKYAQETYRANNQHDRHEIHGDIRTLSSAAIPEFEVLLAGFPCQPFSLAGVSKKNALGRPHGFACETQGTLFFEIERILRDRKPRAFLLENVKNLTSHDRGRTFSVIKNVLQDQLGYRISYRVIDARAWVPQHRERIFIVGFRDDVGFSLEDLPIPDGRPDLRQVLHGAYTDEAPEPPYTLGPKARVAPKYTLSPKLWTYLQKYAAKHAAKGNGFGFGLVDRSNVARTLSARYYKDGAEILVAQGKKEPRRLTPRECARLMGFDRAGAAAFKIPVSDAQAYRQFGNSVVVPVVEAIAKHMEPALRRALGPTPAATRP